MSLSGKRSEFERHLWDHAADSFQSQFDERRSLTENEISFLEAVYAAAIVPEDGKALHALRQVLLRQDASLTLILQLCGLTRNKILSDLKASRAVKEQAIRLPSSFQGLTKLEPWRVAGPYILSRLRAVLGTLHRTSNTLGHVFEALNQSTWPGYIRQERAKRSGHEAEYRLATLLASACIPFEPFEKADNPLCRDAQIDGISFDIVVPNTTKPVLVIKSTVHTANIGQYGESKDDLEVREARQWIDRRFGEKNRPTLLAFIDGVGFRSNSAGLNGVLTNADEFCQFDTIWKCALIAAMRLNLPIEIALDKSGRDEFSAFIAKWEASILVRETEKLKSVIGWVEAGSALIRQKES